MTVPVLDLNAIKSLYTKGVSYAKKKYNSPFFDRDDNMFELQQQLVNQATTITEVMNAIWMPNSTWSTRFKSPKAICDGCELDYTGIQFGTGHIGWYFLYGVAGNITFQVSFFRLEIAPPEVIKNEMIDPSEAVRWIVLGGFGQLGGIGTWYTIPAEWVYLKYTQPTSSTFSLAGTGTNVNVSFSSLIPMQFDLNLSYSDTNKNPHTLIVHMTAISPPSPNFKNSFSGGAGLGTFYYSYTNMNITISADNSELQQGSGWIDHQFLKTGVADTVYVQALQTLASLISKNITGGWLWISIIDNESGLQYMIVHFFGTKFYADDVKINTRLRLDIINVYKNGVAYFKPTQKGMNYRDCKVVPIQTTLVNGVNLPSKYNIVLPGGKQCILSLAGQPNVYPTATAPYENPSILYDLNMKTIGIGIIEANGYFTNDVYAQRELAQAGETGEISLDIVKKSIEKPQSTWQKIFGVLTALLPLWIILLIIFFVLIKKDKRKVRLWIVLCVVLIVIMTVALQK